MTESTVDHSAVTAIFDAVEESQVTIETVEDWVLVHFTTTDEKQYTLAVNLKTGNVGVYDVDARGMLLAH